MGSDVETLKLKLLSGECRSLTNVKGKSDVWKSFKLIVNSNRLQDAGFVQCISCSGLLRYSKGKNGTSTMMRHKCCLKQNKVFKDTFYLLTVA